MRGTCAAPSLACVSAIARATHSCPLAPDAHTLCSTTGADGCPGAVRYGGSTAAVTSARKGACAGSSAIAAAAATAMISGQPRAGISNTPRTFADKSPTCTSDASVR